MTPTASGERFLAASSYASSDAANSRSISTCAYGPFVSQSRQASSASSSTPSTVTGGRGARSVVVIGATLPLVHPGDAGGEDPDLQVEQLVGLLGGDAG